jgi:hypothetical protein
MVETSEIFLSTLRQAVRYLIGNFTSTKTILFQFDSSKRNNTKVNQNKHLQPHLPIYNHSVFRFAIGVPTQIEKETVVPRDGKP